MYSPASSAFLYVLITKTSERIVLSLSDVADIEPGTSHSPDIPAMGPLLPVTEHETLPPLHEADISPKLQTM